MKPGLIYAALIAITVTGVSLFLRATISVPKGNGMPVEAAGSVVTEEKVPTSKQEAAADNIAESGVSATESANSKDGEE